VIRGGCVGATGGRGGGGGGKSFGPGVGIGLGVVALGPGVGFVNQVRPELVGKTQSGSNLGVKVETFRGFRCC
jgi:hypothetical protein